MTRFGVRRPRYGRFLAVCTHIITNYPKDPAFEGGKGSKRKERATLD